jgi:hypothetical protein
MKKFFLMIMALVLVFATAEAQKLVSAKPYGSKGLYTITPTNDTITITPKYSASAYVMPVDTNVYIMVDTTAALPLNLVYFQLKADATKRYVYFDTGFQAAPAVDSIAATKTRVYTFVTSSAGKFTLIGRSTEY